jgi:hypothetical protein
VRVCVVQEGAFVDRSLPIPRSSNEAVISVSESRPLVSGPG